MHWSHGAAEAYRFRYADQGIRYFANLEYLFKVQLANCLKHLGSTEAAPRLMYIIAFYSVRISALLLTRLPSLAAPA